MKARQYEDRTRNGDAGMHRRAGSVRAIRRAGGRCAGRTACADRTPPAGLSEESRSEPQPARAEAKGQAFRFFGPRGRFLEGKRFYFGLRGLAGEVLVPDALVHAP